MTAFCVTIQCMDGRIQRPIQDYILQHYGYQYADTITEPGVNHILAENKEACVIDALIEKLQISIGKHGSDHIFISGHADCVANPALRESQTEQITQSKKWLEEQFPGLKVTGLWVNETWEVEEV